MFKMRCPASEAKGCVDDTIPPVLWTTLRLLAERMNTGSVAG